MCTSERGNRANAITVLALSAGLYLLSVAMLLRVESRLLALAAFVVAVVILGLGLRDWPGTVERVGEASRGSPWSLSAGSWPVLGPSLGRPRSLRRWVDGGLHRH